jgi:uncharacterized phosphosugar-binding protein
VADVVLDNGALLEGPDGVRVCGVSSLTSAMLVQMVVAETVGLLSAAGIEPPVYVSANLPGGFERNLAIEREYGDRLHRAAM